MRDLDAWARHLDEHSGSDQACFVLELLAGTLAQRGEVLPEHLDGALARAITAGDRASELLGPLRIDRRSRIIARVRNAYWLRRLRELGDPEEIAHHMIPALVADRAWPADHGARNLVVALGHAAVEPLTVALQSPAGDDLSPRHREVFTGALDELQGVPEHRL